MSLTVNEVELLIFVINIFLYVFDI